MTATAEETTTDGAILDERGHRKTRIGLVTSDKMEKTIVVSIMTLKQHPLYGRTVKRTTKFKAHDETSESGVGDTVEIMECRPLSREKQLHEHLRRRPLFSVGAEIRRHQQVQGFRVICRQAPHRKAEPYDGLHAYSQQVQRRLRANRDVVDRHRCAAGAARSN